MLEIAQHYPGCCCHIESTVNKLVAVQQVRQTMKEEPFTYNESSLCRHQCLTIDLGVITFPSIFSEEGRHPISEDR